MKVFMISLGCAKNQVDSEMILGLLKKEGTQIVSNAENADVLLLNTCGFIESAKEEGINTILDLAQYKKGNVKLIVCGCLPQRYREELIQLLPEVDRFIRIDEYGEIAQIIQAIVHEDLELSAKLSPLNRVYSTPMYYRYVKISEGCTNRCAYCAIPLIRGDLRSREMQSIIEEVQMHAREGVKEINLISQDTTKYGFDLYKRLAITELLASLVAIPGDFKIRLLYLYPSIVTDELIMFIKNNSKVMPYFDIPIQHSEDRLLKLMNRQGDSKQISLVMNSIRTNIPHAIIRTTLIVGFPSETIEDFESLLKFISVNPFDRLGAFTYSMEEGTASALMPQLISEDEKTRRYNKLMDLQSQISLKLNRDKINQVFEVLIEEYDEESFMYIGRTFGFAPDGIDGCVYVAAHEELTAGQVIKIKIVDADQFTLTGEQLDE